MFRKSFVLNGFSEDYVHYLPKQLLSRGPVDGSKPSKVTKALWSVKRSPLYPELEARLAAVELKQTEGDPAKYNENNRTWREAIQAILIDYASACSITLGRDTRCGDQCCDEDFIKDGKPHNFFDSCRF